MDNLLSLIWQQFGSFWLAIALGIGWLLHATGLLGHLIGARVASSEQWVTQRQAFITNMMEELGDARARHAADLADLERRLAEAHERADEERTNARRWRHLIGNLGMFIAVQRRILERNGLEGPRFDWSRFQAEGGDPSEFEGMF